MAMPNFISRLKVRTPSYNIFPIDRVHNKLDMQIGRNYPVKWFELHPGEEIDIKMSQITRFMPMTNPIFHNVNIEFIPFFVPFRLLDEFGFNASDYFNPATPDSDRPAMPMISVNNLYDGVDSIIGGIWDYLRYPTYVHLLRTLQNDKSGFYSLSDYNEDDPSAAGASSQNYYALFASAPTSEADDEDLNGIHIYSASYGFYTNVFRFYPYVARERLRAIGETEIQVDTTIPLERKLTDYDSFYEGQFWDMVYRDTGKRQDEFMVQYMVYLHMSLFNAYSNAKTLQDVSLLPWLCYCRLIYDWFVNTNLTDLSSFPSIISNVLSSVNDGDSFATALSDIQLDDVNNSSLCYFFPFSRSSGGYVARVAYSLWQRDYFTGAMPNSQDGSAVPIPANGTIPDLAGARRLQWFKTLNIFGGKRWIDQIFTHRGVRSSDARMDRCEVIGKKKVWNLQISDVLQTSQSTIDSVQGDFAGHGISYGGDHLCHYRAEEPGLIMVIGRVRPKLSYMSAVPKLIFKSDFYDFEQPEFDNVGMQPILRPELQSGTAVDSNVVFGWTRRYAEYLTDFDEYHGHFLTDLDNWHMARKFNAGAPQLNTVFSVIKSDGSDDLNRIFANPGYRWNVLSDITWDIQVSRPLSKVIEFDF